MPKRPPPWLHGRGRGEGRGPGPDGPQPGEVYDIDSELPGFWDVHEGTWRPVVVVRVAAEVGLVSVIARTTDLGEKGVHHDRQPDWGLDMEGVFARRWHHTLDLSMFVAPLVRLLGTLDEETWADVWAMWEQM